LVDINTKLRTSTLTNHSIKDKQTFTFVSFDTINFSTTQQLLYDALKFATTHSKTTSEEINIIMNDRKSLLSNTNQPWV